MSGRELVVLEVARVPPAPGRERVVLEVAALPLRSARDLPAGVHHCDRCSALTDHVDPLCYECDDRSRSA